jgi:hypothetical protein
VFVCPSSNHAQKMENMNKKHMVKGQGKKVGVLELSQIEVFLKNFYFEKRLWLLNFGGQNFFLKGV